MEPVKRLGDLRPSAIAPYGVGAAPGHDGAVIHDLYLLDHGAASRPPASPAPGESPATEPRLSAQLMAVQEHERRRIAADLHDGIGQSLSLIKLSMESAVQQMLAGQNQQAIESMQRMVHRVKDAMAELRRATTDLHPPMLDDLGIIPTVTWFLREIETACPGKRIERQISLAEGDVPAALKATIFRILQEATNNVVKHADADRVKVTLSRVSDAILLAVEDNGRGFDPRLPADGHGGGMGLLTMRERAISSYGTFDIQSAPGQGTRIQAVWRFKGPAPKRTPGRQGGKK